jgi:ATP-dependent DNA helicase RecG
MSKFFDTHIQYLKGVGEQWGRLLKEELNIHTYADLLQHYPFRHEDRSQFHTIAEIHGEMPYVQLIGHIRSIEMVGEGNKKRLVAHFHDNSGEIELIWFQGINWVKGWLKMGVEYVVFGKPNQFGRKLSIAHPEIELFTEQAAESKPLQPVYHTSDKMKRKRLDSKAISRLQQRLLQLAYQEIPETLPDKLIQEFGLVPKRDAIQNIHFPQDANNLEKARFRLKFEELFYVQLRILKLKLHKMERSHGQILSDTRLVHEFYNNYLPFELTEAQKRVIRDIFTDLRTGKQMNRLLQGDVGSGKTMVAFICMLIAVGSGAQVAMMAPTEILAEQHFRNLQPYAEKLGLNIALLTGSTRQKIRRRMDDRLQLGSLHILVGTHALLEERVQFKNLGLAVVDEQHRFGVAQRAKLWQKNENFFPHILVMTATPIPRTLAMTLYGDLDVSVIDELPPGRKPIKTVHRYDKSRLQVFEFIREQVRRGHQVYIVYPLIEESEKLDLKHLEDGYESVRRAFPDVAVSCVHGKMNPGDKDFEMQQFVEGKSKIMVATTVIEVGVDVPNASVMVIENAERFGLAQLHQLRGRVGRGADQSYCILMTSYKLSKESRIRLETMVRTNDGFEIAETDLKLRGPGDLSGTQQSGVLDLLVADLAKDGKILQAARVAAQEILNQDSDLSTPAHIMIAENIQRQRKETINWSKIS